MYAGHLHEMTREKTLFGIGLMLGIGALAVLFVSPSDRLWLFPLTLSGVLTAPRKSEQESTKDVSNIALTIAFFAVAFLFALFLIPDAVWSRFDLRVPDWAYGRTHEREVVPMWARVVLAAVWSVVTWRRFQQLGAQRAETAV